MLRFLSKYAVKPRTSRFGHWPARSLRIKEEARGMSHQHHSVDYIEFTVADMDQSKSFYYQAFGWEFTDYAPTYAGIKGADKEIGGFTVGEPSAGGPLLVLYSDDLEATLASVKKAGAEIVKPVFEFPGGRRFHFRDPNGVELAVWGQPN